MEEEMQVKAEQRDQGQVSCWTWWCSVWVIKERGHSMRD